MSWLAGLLLALTVLLGGAYLVAVLDAALLHLASGRPAGAVAALPLRRAFVSLRRQWVTTEAPDPVGRCLAPVLYFGLALLALMLVPLGPGQVLLDIPVGVVAWGAVESLTVVAIFLHGWSQNSLFPLLGGYRFVAVGLSAMLLSMFVLIGTALPAQSLAFPDIVESQRTLWNVVRQPLGLPLFLVLGYAVSLRSFMDFGDSADLAAGTSTEDSGWVYGGWQLARSAVLVSFSAVAATSFLGGYLGPLLPGPLWLTVKTVLVLAMMVALGHVVTRPDTARAMTFLWTVLLPLSFLSLAMAGLGSLR